MSSANAAYPPQNSLQAALQNREAMDSLATVQLDQQAGAAQQSAHEGINEGQDGEAMRLKGGCFDCGLCGCPDVECCCIPCTIS
ncbi:uncharacterized protein JCM10292_007556 [Rhodotorula paludigena]|uniref:uncharacterized protein n=1 Tax=Rhodotorula paludigena TaxID=86838 RepID=UPI00316DED73